MTRARAVHFLAVAFSIAAAVISLQLLNKHVGGSSGARWFDAGCSDSTEPGSANCAAVLASPYSYFPARKPGAQGGAGLPVAFLGLLYYSVLCFWLLGVGRPSRSRRWLHGFPLLFVGFGLAMSAYYVNVMFRVLDQWCPWCAVTHGLNLGIAVCLVLMWPGRARAAASAAPPTAFPSARVVSLTVLAIATLVFAEVNMLARANYKRQLEVTSQQLAEVVKRVTGDPAAMVRAWEAAPKRDLVIREDDPVRLGPHATKSQAPLEVLVFSDFECQYCARFAALFEGTFTPLFAGNVRTVFKHYPIDQSCNDRVGRTLHPHACFGATVAEAARTVAGKDGFWLVHDYLFANREELAAGHMTLESVATATKLSPAALTQASTDPAIRSRLSEDIELARIAEIKGTPAVFVEGRMVDTVAAMEVGFWDKLADVYWQRIGVPRPESTRPKTAATPGTPSPKAGP